MSIKLEQLQQQVTELEISAGLIQELAYGLTEGKKMQPELQIKTQQWYRAARALLAENGYSGLEEFEGCYQNYVEGMGAHIKARSIADIENYTKFNDPVSTNLYNDFLVLFTKARALLLAFPFEARSKLLSIKSQLSFEIANDEFKTANELITVATDETLLRAAGVIARVALERHLWTVIEAHNITVLKNPVSKKKADTQDLLTTLVKSTVITPIQRSELDSLFTVGNNCAHPKESVIKSDVERLVTRGQQLSAVIL